MKDLCRRIGISDATFYHWKAKYGGLEVNEIPATASAGGRERTAEEDRGAAGAGPRRAEGGAVKKVVGPRAKREAVRVVRRRSKTQRATRLWADRDAPRELALPAKRTERSGVAGSAASSWQPSGRASAIGGCTFSCDGRRARMERCGGESTTSECIGCTGRKGLAMQRKRRKRFRAEARVPLVLPTRANEMWTMDYTHDELAGGRKFRTLNLMDGYTREALRIEPDTSLPGLRVVRVSGVVAGTTRNTGGDPGRQRNGVHQPRRGSVGLSESGGAAFY